MRKGYDFGWILVLSALFTFSDASSQTVNQDLSNIFNELWKLDVNRLKPGTHYNISLQGKAGYIRQGSTSAVDHASSPLFTSVDEAKLNSITTYDRFRKLLDNYERSTGVAERVTAEEVTENNSFLDAVLETAVMKFGTRRGFSERNVRRWCAEQGLVMDFCPDSQLEVEVANGIAETGSSFGRKMMTGYLSAKGVKASEGRVGKVLKGVHQPYHAARQQGARNLNPIPYSAEYMGHKLHVDQNEKLVMFGVTHVMAIDGFSKKVVGHSTMPIKNNIIIYEEVYRPAVLSYGLWDQVRVDCGKEFYLTLFIQENLAEHRHNPQRQPYIQTPSTRNHVIERMWSEVNARVNYPLKSALVQLVNQEELDMEDNISKYCVSNLTCQMARIGITNVIEAWNSHRIPGKGIPNELAKEGCPTKLQEDQLPVGTVAADLYQQELGSALKRESIFGCDPFPSEEAQQWTETEFGSHFDLLSLHQNVINHNYGPFKDAVLSLIDITRSCV